MEPLIEMISTVGFPIVCVLILFYYVKYLTDQHNEEIKELRKEMIDNNNELRKSIEANTLITQKLYERMTRDD